MDSGSGAGMTMEKKLRYPSSNCRPGVGSTAGGTFKISQIRSQNRIFDRRRVIDSAQILITKHFTMNGVCPFF